MIEWGDSGTDQNALEMWDQFKEMLDAVKNSDNIHLYSRWKPYILAFHALLRDICQTYSQAQIDRFIGTWKHYVEGNIEETLMQQKRGRQNVEEYLKVSCILDIRISKQPAEKDCCELTSYFDPNEDELLIPHIYTFKI